MDTPGTTKQRKQIRNGGGGAFRQKEEVVSREYIPERTLCRLKWEKCARRYEPRTLILLPSYIFSPSMHDLVYHGL